MCMASLSHSGSLFIENVTDKLTPPRRNPREKSAHVIGTFDGRDLENLERPSFSFQLKYISNFEPVFSAL